MAVRQARVGCGWFAGWRGRPGLGGALAGRWDGGAVEESECAWSERPAWLEWLRLVGGPPEVVGGSDTRRKREVAG